MAVPLVLGKKSSSLVTTNSCLMMDENTIDSALEKIGKKEIAEKLQKAESQFKRLFEAAAKLGRQSLPHLTHNIVCMNRS